MPLSLPEHPVLAEELDRPIARSMDADLSVGHDPESVLEADLRAGVDAEQIGGEVAEVPLTERAGEAVGYAKGALEFRQPKRRRQGDQRKIRLCQFEHRIVFILRRNDRR